jgi:hypothetical protein
MIGNFMKKLQAPKDLSHGRPGIKKVSNGTFYIYKLDNSISSTPTNTPSRSTEPAGRAPIDHQSSKLGYNHQAIAAHLQEIAEKEMKAAIVDEKHVLYGSENSPIKNPEVIAAWGRAKEAQKRLEAHREYMERVRKARENLSDKKSITK